MDIESSDNGAYFFSSPQVDGYKTRRYFLQCTLSTFFIFPYDYREIYNPN